MNYLTIFVFFIALGGALAAPFLNDNIPYEEKGVISKVLLHSPVVQLTGQALTDCAPDLISINPIKMAFAGVKCIVKGAASVVDGTRMSLHHKELRDKAKKAN